MTYRLRVTAQAVADADETHAWITEHGSPDQADRWYQGLFTQMETLTKHPPAARVRPKATNSPSSSVSCSTARGRTNTASLSPSVIRMMSCSSSTTVPVTSGNRNPAAGAWRLVFLWSSPPGVWSCYVCTNPSAIPAKPSAACHAALRLQRPEPWSWGAPVRYGSRAGRVCGPAAISNL